MRLTKQAQGNKTPILNYSKTCNKNSLGKMLKNGLHWLERAFSGCFRLLHFVTFGVLTR